MHTTLNAIRSHQPCAEGWRKLLTHLGKTSADDEPLSILEVLKSNGLQDALWCLRAVDGRDREIRLLAVAYARRAEHLLTDPRSVAALDVAERYANGAASDGELKAASAAAWAAVAAVAAVAVAVAEAAAEAAEWSAAAVVEWSAAAVVEAVKAVVAAAEAELRWQADELRRLCQAASQMSDLDPHAGLLA